MCCKRLPHVANTCTLGYNMETGYDLQRRRAPVAHVVLDHPSFMSYQFRRRIQYTCTDMTGRSWQMRCWNARLSRRCMPNVTLDPKKDSVRHGRAPVADAVLDHPSISRLHAAVCYEGLTGAWRVVDLGSAHGTFVDGRAVDKVCRPPLVAEVVLMVPYPVAGNDARAEARRWCILFSTKIMYYRRCICSELLPDTLNLVALGVELRCVSAYCQPSNFHSRQLPSAALGYCAEHAC